MGVVDARRYSQGCLYQEKAQGQFNQFEVLKYRSKWCRRDGIANIRLEWRFEEALRVVGAVSL